MVLLRVVAGCGDEVGEKVDADAAGGPEGGRSILAGLGMTGLLAPG